jgi:hypothetical protein
MLDDERLFSLVRDRERVQLVRSPHGLRALAAGGGGQQEDATGRRSRVEASTG